MNFNKLTAFPKNHCCATRTRQSFRKAGYFSPKLNNYCELPEKHMNKRWSREEIILILELYWQLSTEEIKKQRERHPMIIALANKMGAADKANSIYMRLLNFVYLDLNEKGGLHKVAKEDEELWTEFYNQWDKFAVACQKARETLQIPPAVEGTVADDADFSAETRKAITAQRIRQHDFRQRILANYENCCCISGISEPRLLVASHIVPWHIDKKNRLNPENGLCLSPLYDSAFDSGLISLDDEMKVILSPRIKNNDSLYPFFMAYEGKPITMPFRYKPHPELIKYHRTYIFNHD